MGLNEVLEVAGGTLQGRDHLHAGRNSQDAFHVSLNERALVAVVCDGCSDGHRNEVGAVIGSRLVVDAIHRYLHMFDVGRENDFFEMVRHDVLASIRGIASAMSSGESLRSVIRHHFLFTIVGTIVVEDYGCVFSLGDGVYIFNAEVNRMGPFPGNQPPYLAYGMLDTSLGRESPELLRFKVQRCFRTDAMSSVLIGSDGVADFIDAAEKNFPGKTTTLGSISQFWLNDRYFKNPDTVRRTLAGANTPSVRPDWDNRRLAREGGLLPDDTTLVVIRRRPAESVNNGK
jgi:hypothetical protein